MAKTTKVLLALALATLTACDYAQRADVRAEQRDRLYKTAMEDYAAGRLEAAISGLEKTIANDPANASARFQLACLLQEGERDVAGAYCEYREFLSQQPTSDKAKLAKQRMADCERLLAASLAKKYGVGASESAARETAALKLAASEAKAQCQAVEKRLQETQAKLAAMTTDRDRLQRLIKGAEESADVADASSLQKDARALLDEVDEADVVTPPSAEAVAELKEDAEEELTSGSELLVAPNSRTAPTNVVKKAERPMKPPIVHPDTYKIVEGDTLYKIAKRFYGRISAWKEIRDANKGRITTDGRVRVGDTIKLP